MVDTNGRDVSAGTQKNGGTRLWEVVGWIVLVAVLWGTDLLAKLGERDQAGFGKETYRLVVEQVTSGMAALVMVLFLVQWLRLFPLRIDTWPRAVIGHSVGSVIFAFGHFVLMVVMRATWFGITGQSYVWRDPFVSNLLVEYQKDIKIYLGFVVVIAAYQHFRRSKRSNPDSHTDRLVVQSGSGDTILRIDQIEYLEAARNYVSVYANDREYVVRDTMTNMLRRLSTGPFIQTHRSYVVNIDRVGEIRSVDSGHKVLLQSGRDVPLSRGYREAFMAAIKGDA